MGLHAAGFHGRLTHDSGFSTGWAPQSLAALTFWFGHANRDVCYGASCEPLFRRLGATHDATPLSARQIPNEANRQMPNGLPKGQFHM